MLFFSFICIFFSTMIYFNNKKIGFLKEVSPDLLAPDLGWNSLCCSVPYPSYFLSPGHPAPLSQPSPSLHLHPGTFLGLWVESGLGRYLEDGV